MTTGEEEGGVQGDEGYLGDGVVPRGGHSGEPLHEGLVRGIVRRFPLGDHPGQSSAAGGVLTLKPQNSAEIFPAMPVMVSMSSMLSVPDPSPEPLPMPHGHLAYSSLSMVGLPRSAP